MRFKEIVESAGATCSGGIAPVATPLGATQTRGGSLLTGKYSNGSDPTPNTPKEYKRNKNVSRCFKNSPGN